MKYRLAERVGISLAQAEPSLSWGDSRPPKALGLLIAALAVPPLV